MIKETMFVIAVPDLEKSADYYKEVLGFQVEEIGDPGWRKYSRDNCHIMAGNCPSNARRPLPQDYPEPDQGRQSFLDQRCL